MNTDWQSLVAISIALACSAWIVRYIARPFVTRIAQVCRKCDPPSPAADETADLLQIEPAVTPKKQH